MSDPRWQERVRNLEFPPEAPGTRDGSCSTLPTGARDEQNGRGGALRELRSQEEGTQGK